MIGRRKYLPVLRSSLAVLAVGVMLAPLPAQGWLFRVDTPGDDEPFDIATDSAGGILVAGALSDQTQPVIFKLSPDGQELWRALGSPSSGNALFRNAAIDAADDIVVTDRSRVSKYDGGNGSELWTTVEGGRWDALTVELSTGDVIVGGVPDTLVARLDGATGAIEWQATLGGVVAGSGERVEDIVVAPNGDVIVAGSVNGPGTGGDFVVARLSGSDGSEIWRVGIDETGLYDLARRVAVDAAGDVIAGGHLQLAMGPRAVVVKLDGTSGAELWRYDGALGLTTQVVVSVPGGDALVSDEAGLTRLDGATGGVLWNAPTLRAGNGTLAPNATFTVGAVANPGLVGVAQVDVATGLLLWQIATPSYPLVAIGPMNDVVAAGERGATPVPSSDSALEVLGFSDRLAGERLILKDKDGDPSRRRVVLVVKDPNVVTSEPATQSDPAVVGAELHLSNPTTGESVVLDLPAANWTTPADGRHVYKDAAKAGPCLKANVDRGKRLKVKCLGPGIPFTLDEPSQGGVDVRLVVPGGMRHCLTFTGPGVVLRDKPATEGRTGVFKARQASQPAACP